MRSTAARETSQSRLRRLAAMSPAERVARSERLGKEGIASYVATHGLDRTRATAGIKATHSLRRRDSRSATADHKRAGAA